MKFNSFPEAFAISNFLLFEIIDLISKDIYHHIYIAFYMGSDVQGNYTFRISFRDTFTST